MLTGSFLILSILLVYWVYRWLTLYRHRIYGWRRQNIKPDITCFPRYPPKPVWVNIGCKLTNSGKRSDSAPHNSDPEPGKMRFEKNRGFLGKWRKLS